MRDNFFRLAPIIALLSLLVGCNSPAPNNSSKLKVVATHSVICDLTTQIAATTIDLKCLGKGGTDPHNYQATPDDRQAIEAANLIFYNGYHLEPAIERLIQSAPPTTPKIAVAELAVPQPLKQGSEIDPHVWHNARNGIAMVNVIQTQLVQSNPMHAATYNQNARGLNNQLTVLDGWIKGSIATIPPQNRKLITTHDSLAYYGAAYGLVIEGALQGLSTDEQPTPTRVKQLVDAIKATQVPIIFPETSVNPALITTVAQEAQVRLAPQPLFADGLGAPGSGAASYLPMLEGNTRAIVTGLGGKI
jgi:manganese/iron transport system substrate-binding protein